MFGHETMGPIGIGPLLINTRSDFLIKLEKDTRGAASGVFLELRIVSYFSQSAENEEEIYRRIRHLESLDYYCLPLQKNLGD